MKITTFSAVLAALIVGVALGSVTTVLTTNVNNGNFANSFELNEWRRTAYEVIQYADVPPTVRSVTWKDMKPEFLKDTLNPCLPSTYLARGAYYQAGCRHGEPIAPYFISRAFVSFEDRVVQTLPF